MSQQINEMNELQLSSLLFFSAHISEFNSQSLDLETKGAELRYNFCNQPPSTQINFVTELLTFF